MFLLGRKKLKSLMKVVSNHFCLKRWNNFNLDELQGLDLKKLTTENQNKQKKAKPVLTKSSTPKPPKGGKDGKQTTGVLGKLASISSFLKKSVVALDSEPNEENESRGSESEGSEEEESEPELKAEATRNVRKADTNIFSVNLGNLAEGITVLTGDPLFCLNCKAVYNCLSRNSLKTNHEEKNPGKEEEGDRLWICEFCEQENSFNLMEEEIPKDHSVDFLLESAKKQEVKEEQNVIIFCIGTTYFSHFSLSFL
jgi:hypothetical protein